MLIKSVNFAFLLLLVYFLDQSRSEEKWVWNKSNDRSSRRIGLGRYEIYEPGPELNRPGPEVIPQGPIPGLASQLTRPGSYYPQRPPGPGNFAPPPEIPDPPGHYPPYQGGPDRNNFGYGDGNGILIGPSYAKGPFEYIDSCKCTERFNCKGTAYGSCDVGKQYCCNGRKSGPPPSRPVHSIDNGILVGPGGPSGPLGGNNFGFGRPFRPGNGGNYAGALGYNPGPRPGFGIDNGVLVGPGYQGYQGPGGLGSYGRSANKKE